jgi:hypothetical protein
MDATKRGEFNPAFFLLSVLIFEQIASKLLFILFSYNPTWSSYQLFLLLYAMKDCLFAGFLAFHKSTGGLLYIVTLVLSSLLCVFCATLINYGLVDVAYSIDSNGAFFIVAAQMIVVVYIIRREYGR